ncbi:MAG: deoxyribose-phosphate aldolase [Rikenellaceae bacterium]|nr:deoxyribose-phosphate aldolase [Rikenellaceae bacterium]
MDYSNIMNRLFLRVSDEDIKNKVEEIEKKLSFNRNKDVYEKCFGYLDLTSLKPTDNTESIRVFARKASELGKNFSHLPNIASLCVFPAFVDVAGIELDDSEIGITSVGAGFPCSQTFLEVKMLECAMAEENGADEIDIVMNVGQFMEGNYEEVANEIEIIRQELSTETLLKVIIESGSLPGLSAVRKASVLAMAAGTDFIKTSTGKNDKGATPEAVVVMCNAIKDYFGETGEKIGIKISGGVSDIDDAVRYYTIVETILGKDWLTPELFRIGASKLGDRLLSAIEDREINYFG